MQKFNTHIQSNFTLRETLGKVRTLIRESLERVRAQKKIPNSNLIANSSK